MSETQQALIAQTLEAAPIGMLAVDAKGRITLVNEQLEQLFGYTRDELYGQSIELLLPERYRAAHPGHRAAFGRDARARPMGGAGRELYARRKDGSEFPIEIGLRPFRSEQGDHVVASVLDVTERRRAAATIASSERRLALATGAAKMGIWDWDVVANELVWDDQMFALYGVERARFPGAYEAWQAGVHPDDRDRAFAAVEAALAGASFDTEFRVLTPEGEVRHLKAHAVVERDAEGVPLRMIGTNWDISAMRAAEAELEAKAQELAAAARIDRVSAELMVALASSEAKPVERALGVLRAEGGYRPIALFEFDEWSGRLSLRSELGLGSAAPRTYRVGEGLVGEAAATRDPVFVEADPGSPLVLDTGLGRIASAQLFALPLVHQDVLLGVIVGSSPRALGGRERAWLGQVAAQVAVGLSALRQFEQLRDLSEQLNERTLRIDRQNRELARANRLKSEFLASMSHELRTPLNAVIGFSEVLKDGVLGELPEEQRDYVEEIHGAGRHLLSLINDILDLSKIEAGKMELDLAELDLEELVDNALTIVRERAHRGRVKISGSVEPTCRSLVADGRKVRQIVYNLLSNAVKFTGSGGEVSLTCRCLGDQVELSVEDTGIGIATDDLGRLFTPFEQLDGGIDRRYEGTGLGLAMVKRLAELHGGEVGVESVLGEGSRFWVRLPRGAVPSPVPDAVELVAPVHAGPTVLLVDDDPAAVAITQAWLDAEGYTCRSAASPSLALEAVREQRPDAVLLDLLFAGQPDGYTFLQSLRADPATAGVPVIIVSIVADRARGLAAGAQAVLHKPVTAKDLFDALATVGLGPGVPLEGRSVLVVDDDPRAVEHVGRRLEHEGVAVTRAFDGEAALEALRRAPFDAVVLDLMMPGLSGFDVLDAMRDDPAMAEVPVIVLTAKILEPDERERLEQHVARLMAKAEWDERHFVASVRRVLDRPGAPRAVSGFAPEGEGARVLVIDDDQGMRRVLRLYLEDAGHTVAEAESVGQALNLAELGRPDLVTLDLRLPGLDGFAFLEAMADRPSLRGVPVVVVSGDDTRDRSGALGASAVLGKPVERHALLEVVDRLLAEVGSSLPRVLLIDDDPRAHDLIRAYVRGQPYALDVAGGGEAGLRAIRERLPDLVLLDLQMPGLSGFEVLEALRGDPRTVDLPVVIVTATQTTKQERGLLEGRAQGLFAKHGLRPAELLEHVERLLGGREA